MKHFNAQFITKSPLAHGAEKGFVRPKSLPEGAKDNYVPFRRMPVATTMSDGKPGIIYTPIHSGNGFRGQFRRFGEKVTLDALGINIMDLPAVIYYFLTSGGGLDSKSSAENDAAEGKGSFPLLVRNRLTLRALFPLVSLFGASYGNKMLEGLVNIGPAIPVLAETENVTGVPSERHFDEELLSFQMATRRDDAPFDSSEMSTAKALEALGVTLTSQQAKEIKEKESKQAIYYQEVLAAGVMMHHWFSLKDMATPIEESLLSLILIEFKTNSFIGGKSAAGYGKIEFVQDYTGVSPLEPGTTYLNWLKANKQTILEYMACWDNPKKILALKDPTKPFDVKNNPVKSVWPEKLSVELDRLVSEREILSTKPDAPEAQVILAKYR